MPMQQAIACLTGLAGLAVMWAILLIATKKHPWALVIGEDGRPSTSKLQMLVWTAAVIFAFLAIYQVRFALGYRGDLPGVPTNLLLAMGISVVTAVSAKSIAVKAAAVASTPTTPASSGKSGIFCDDSGMPDMGKVQVMLWTLIAVGIFLAEVFAILQSPNCPAFDPAAGHTTCALSLPDIGTTLMILMGLGHGAYLGKKIAES